MSDRGKCRRSQPHATDDRLQQHHNTIATEGQRRPVIGGASAYPRRGAAHRMSASLIGHSRSSAFRLSAAAVSMSLTGSCFSSESAPRPFHHGIRERGGTISSATLPSVPYGGFKRTCELTSSIVPRGTSFHHSVDLEFPPIALRFAGSIGSRCRQPRCGGGSQPTDVPERRSPFSSRGAWRSASPTP